MANIMDDFPSKYLKAEDVEDHPTVTMKLVTREDVGKDKDRKPILYVREFDKGIVLNKTNANNISKMYGTDTDDWPGRVVVLGTAMVDFNGESKPAIRIWPPKRQAGQQQPQANTRMSVNDPQLNQQARQQYDDRSPPPPTDDDTPFFAD